jgi:hypothetical protein
LKRIRTRAGTSTAEQQDVLRPGALLARLAKVAAAPDLPLIFRLMDRFGTTAGPEPHAIVEAALHVPGRGAEDGLIRWFDRYEKLQIHIAIGLIARSSFPRDELDQLIARGAARTQMIAKTIQHAPDAQATLLRYLRGDDIGDKLAAAQLAGITEQASARADLLGLLTFEDARYYPNDALIRHAAMTSLLRIGLATSRPSAAAAAGAEVTEPAGEAPPAAPATPPSGTGESAPRSP